MWIIILSIKHPGNNSSVTHAVSVKKRLQYIQHWTFLSNYQLCRWFLREDGTSSLKFLFIYNLKEHYKSSNSIFSPNIVPIFLENAVGELFNYLGPLSITFGNFCWFTTSYWKQWLNQSHTQSCWKLNWLGLLNSSSPEISCVWKASWRINPLHWCLETAFVKETEREIIDWEIERWCLNLVFSFLSMKGNLEYATVTQMPAIWLSPSLPVF